MSDKTSVTIPVVDLDEFNITKNPEDVSQQVQLKLAADICDAFTTVGFVCLRNHGILPETLDSLMKEARDFFALPQPTKKKYSRRENKIGGWVCVEGQSSNPDQPGDLKEAFDISDERNMEEMWPDEEVPGLRSASDHFSQLCWTLAQRVLLLMGLGLGLDNPAYFNELHQKPGTNNSSLIRCLFYPPIQNDADIKPNQIRCGEHSDCGSITLIFQDDAGGLELRTRDGEFVPATPMAYTVLVNIGDLMQRWTSDKLTSTKHRVVIPEKQVNRERARMSVVYFMQPDDDCVIQSLDGTNKYDPITSLDYVNKRVGATYGK
ncbi:2-oxoglutarate-dependent dioxygenase htyE [Lamellibrachia satsuma]|nr:2-oxoglutarate-dependent dioxygenase htyE [Lamellibrachia satsuma]